MEYTVSEIENGTAGELIVDLSDYVRNEVSTIIDLEGLKEKLGNKLDKTPEHRHNISAITELKNELDSKLSANKTYSYKTIISDIEKIETLESPTITNTLNLRAPDESTEYSVYATNDGLVITESSKATPILKYQKLDDTVWIQGENLTKFIKDTNAVLKQGENLTKFIKDTNAVLKNHYDAIKLIAEKVGLTDSGKDEDDSTTPTE